MKNNKAFTLVEVVAVITILGVILAIAVPKVLSTIDQSKRSAFEVSANKLLDVAIKEYSKNVEEKEYIIENGEFVGDSFKLQGKMPDSGSINVLDDGTVAFAVNNDKWCAIKRTTEDKIQIIPYDGDCQISTPINCFTYTKTATAVTITGYDNSCIKDVVIPSRIEGLPVTIIGSQAFRNKQITKVDIPNGVKMIESISFSGNYINYLKIPDSVVYISNQAFTHNKLSNVILSKNLSYMGQEAFSHNLIESIDIPNSLTFLHAGVFLNNRLTTITIPDRITSIGGLSFAYNQLTSVTIPSSVIYFNSAFNNNQLSDSDAFFYGRNLDGTIDNTILVSYGGAKRSNVIIPDNVKTIAEEAFRNNQLTSVTIPNSVTTIGYYAFATNELENIVIPNSVTQIDSEAFYNNWLTSITIPSNVSIVNDSISQSFYNAYNPNKLSGTYTALDQYDIWTKW